MTTTSEDIQHALADIRNRLETLESRLAQESHPKLGDTVRVISNGQQLGTVAEIDGNDCVLSHRVYLRESQQLVWYPLASLKLVTDKPAVKEPAFPVGSLVKVICPMRRYIGKTGVVKAVHQTFNPYTYSVVLPDGEMIEYLEGDLELTKPAQSPTEQVEAIQKTLETIRTGNTVKIVRTPDGGYVGQVGIVVAIGGLDTIIPYLVELPDKWLVWCSAVDPVESVEPPQAPRTALQDVLRERQQQDARWGGPAHDDEHTDGFLTNLAIARVWYAASTRDLPRDIQACINSHGVPGASLGGSCRQRLVEAAALLLAEIERQDRAEEAP